MNTARVTKGKSAAPSSKRTAGEEMFEAYLAEHEYAAPEHEPDLGVDTRPDYVVRRDKHECVCEVKEFDVDQPGLPWMGQRTGTTSMQVALAPIRKKIREAARQLKPLAGSGRPLVVVLANPHGVFVPLDDHDVVYAMYGDPTYTIPIDPETGAGSGGSMGAGRNGKLRADHPYISAVAIVRERQRIYDFHQEVREKNPHLSPEEYLDVLNAASARGEAPTDSYHRIDVFKTVSPDAVALPEIFFDGENDRLLEYQEEAGGYVQVRGRVFK